MGAAQSRFEFWRHPNPSLREVQNLILDYLNSDDYTVGTDPQQYLPQIKANGYTTLEEFIHDIPLSRRNDEIVRHKIASYKTPIQIGWRYVLINDPTKRGVLASPIEQFSIGYMATLHMDTTPRRGWFIFNIVIYLLYLIYPLRYIFVKFFGDFRNKNPLSCFKLEDLLLEKHHLLAYLKCHDEMPNKLDNHVAKDQINDFMTSDSSADEAGNGIPVQELSAPKYEGVQVNQMFAVNDNGGISQEKSVKEEINNIDAAAQNSPGPVGKHKGIEGANNSCYMDSLLFSMFYTSTAFDFLLENKHGDKKYIKKTRRILRQNIIAPLRENYFCDYESVMDLRTHLSPKNEDLLGAFMDAEQIIYLLCEEVLAENQFIQYASDDDDGWGDMMHLMSIDGSDPSKVITVQRNVEMSFAFNGDIKMAAVPSPAFVLGMPRSNRELIHYEAVIPNTDIDIAGLLQPAECLNCADPASFEIQPHSREMDVNAVRPICARCIVTEWENVKLGEVKVVSRQNMRLRSIITIRGVHFTAFVRTTKTIRGNRKGDSNEWYFFDSMAGSYPEVKIVPKLHKWLEDVAGNPDKFYTSKIPSLVKRSMTDGHLCIYEPIYYDD